ncbi:unnamed protein product [Acanthosepion pharaonis]|uniref:Uncharacterized protein n=1 Tax=Acanthosepion pharaonis TaxID=158019 RepID=A0A812ETI1_ACAPH|nr:unnamed protein product [Sepia pharaonis]
MVDANCVHQIITFSFPFISFFDSTPFLSFASISLFAPTLSLSFPLFSLFVLPFFFYSISLFVSVRFHSVASVSLFAPIYFHSFTSISLFVPVRTLPFAPVYYLVLNNLFYFLSFRYFLCFHFSLFALPFPFLSLISFNFPSFPLFVPTFSHSFASI